ncbi:MAG TPA: lyase family protein [Solirubrobacterales bacterium]|nr:lyase family protein [Solirubrobacterales bacterium]
MSDQRRERDFLGEIAIPSSALWGASTARAIENFGAEAAVTLPDRPSFLRAIVQVKIAAARANCELGALDPEIAEAIVVAGREVIAGKWSDQFPVNLLQGGGGTATNMNVNEVLANRAEEICGGTRGAYSRVHPNDHVNRSQSTNDVYPSALGLATMIVGRETVADFERLASAFAARAAAYPGAERLGRTCLRDSLPVSIEATHLAHAHALRRLAESLARALEELRFLPLGGTAVGTGAGAPDGYRELVVRLLVEESGVDLEPAVDLHDAFANLDPHLAVASELERLTLVAAKFAQDLRFHYSGPVGGVAEVVLPPVQAGSSMMPGKVNPVMPEFMLQASFEVRGARHIVECAVAAGELELNVMEPVIAKHLLGALADSGAAARLFAERCIDGLEWDSAVTEANLRGSLLAAVGEAAEVGWEAHRERAAGKRGGRA